VYDLVAWWAAEAKEIDRARQALRLLWLEISDREDPFAAITGPASPIAPNFYPFRFGVWRLIRRIPKKCIWRIDNLSRLCA
jgi:hypothetical protein